MDPMDTKPRDLASLFHHLVSAENMRKDVVVREAAQPVAVCQYLSDGKATGPAAKKVIPDTGRSSDCEPYIGTADLTFVKVAF